MSLVKNLGAVDGISSVETHLKVAFGFSEFLDLSLLFIEEILNDVQNGPEFILSSISYQILSVSSANNDLLDL